MSLSAEQMSYLCPPDCLNLWLQRRAGAGPLHCLNLFLCCFSSGTIEHRDRPYTHVKHFTQADVNNGKLIYRPPQAPSHLQELYQYSFIGETHTHAHTHKPKNPNLTVITTKIWLIQVHVISLFGTLDGVPLRRQCWMWWNETLLIFWFSYFCTFI